MPRVSALRVAALARLADELRFAPRTRLIRIIEEAEKLAARLEPGAVIDERDLVRTLTGYAPDVDDPGAAPGEAVLADLSGFVERLSERARLQETELPAGSVDAEALAQRWGVSARSVARRRREGLIGRRVRDGSGRVRVRFTPAVVAAAEARWARENRRPAGVERVDAKEAERLVRLASRLERRFGWPRSRIVERLAHRTHRAPETVRRALDRRLGPPRRPRSQRIERQALARWEKGETIASIARFVDRSPASVARWVRRERATRIVGWVRSELETGQKEPAPEMPDHPSIHFGLRPPAERDAGGFVDAAHAAPPTDPAAERAMALAHTALRLRASGLSASERDADLDAAETALRWAAGLRVKLAALHQRLALGAIETAIGGPLLVLSPPAIRSLHREAMAALLEGVARHDARRGGGVTAAMNLALTRRLARLPETTAARRTLAASPERAASPGAGLDDWTLAPAPWSGTLAPPPAAAVAQAEPALREWIAARHGLDGAAPLTQESAARRLDHSTQRARALDRASRRLGE